MDKNNKRNAEGYADPTPYKAIYQVSASRQADIEDARRMDDCIKAAKRMFSAAGFDVAGRIVLRNRRTGKLYE